ncbi:hypothetical protein INR49_003954 [Caranx melampygus]|nr:hypothetical protein INR49_003954 [Caranx melampygus]
MCHVPSSAPEFVKSYAAEIRGNRDNASIMPDYGDESYNQTRTKAPTLAVNPLLIKSFFILVVDESHRSLERNSSQPPSDLLHRPGASEQLFQLQTQMTPSGEKLIRSNIKASTFQTRPVIMRRRQGRLGYGVDPVEMQQFGALRSLFVVRRVHLVGDRRIAHVETSMFTPECVELKPPAALRRIAVVKYSSSVPGGTLCVPTDRPLLLLLLLLRAPPEEQPRRMGRFDYGASVYGIAS